MYLIYNSPAGVAPSVPCLVPIVGSNGFISLEKVWPVYVMFHEGVTIGRKARMMHSTHVFHFDKVVASAGNLFLVVWTGWQLSTYMLCCRGARPDLLLLARWHGCHKVPELHGAESNNSTSSKPRDRPHRGGRTRVAYAYTYNMRGSWISLFLVIDRYSHLPRQRREQPICVTTICVALQKKEGRGYPSVLVAFDNCVSNGRLAGSAKAI